MSLPARWWNSEPDGNGDAATPSGPVPSAARCGLCVHACLLTENHWGYCGARYFDGETLLSPHLGYFSSVAVDPIEKKPLYHWRSGSAILSLGSLGCTMRCPFCQNHTIAHPTPGGPKRSLRQISPQALTAQMREMRLHAVAFTYNEPALQAEYILDAAPLLQEAGMATVLVSNGMYSETLLDELCPVTDAANIDLKTFNPKTYARLGGCLDTAKRSISRLLEKGVHVEVTTLVVPGVSDSLEEFEAEVDWLSTLSPTLPLHISRYHPAHRYTAPPTDTALLQRFAAMAKNRLKHVHIGNVPGLR